MKLVDIIRTVAEVGSETPAFVALFNLTKATLRGDEQEVLQQAYDKARGMANAADDAATAALNDAAKK